MASTPAPSTAAPARRQPSARGTPAARTKTQRWTPPETAKLRKLHAEAGDPIDWDELGQRLGGNRTRKMLMNKATALGLRQHQPAAAGGPAWEAQRGVQGDKNKKRKAAAKAALTLASPAGVPPSEPRPKRPAAVAADAAMLAELEAGLKLDRELFTAAGSGIITEANTHKAWAYYYGSVLRRPRRRGWACVRQPSLSGRRSKLLLLLLLFCCCGAAGHGNFGTLLEPLGEGSGQINAVRGFFIPYKPIRTSLNRIRGNPKNHV